MHQPSERASKNGRVTRECIEAQYRITEDACARAPRPTAKQRQEALEACRISGFSEAPTVRMRAVDVPAWSPLPGLGILVLVALVVLLLALGGCVSDADRRLLDHGVAHNMGVAGDASMSQDAREVALDNADAWAALRLSLNGDELPPDTRARLEAYRLEVDGPAHEER